MYKENAILGSDYLGAFSRTSPKATHAPLRSMRGRGKKWSGAGDRHGSAQVDGYDPRYVFRSRCPVTACARALSLSFNLVLHVSRPDKNKMG
jgi:hypothetical protein